MLAGVVEPLLLPPVIVEEQTCWIGANAVVIEGCRIGHDVVAAGAVVRRRGAEYWWPDARQVIKMKDEKPPARPPWWMPSGRCKDQKIEKLPSDAHPGAFLCKSLFFCQHGIPITDENVAGSEQHRRTRQ